MRLRAGAQVIDGIEQIALEGDGVTIAIDRASHVDDDGNTVVTAEEVVATLTASGGSQPSLVGPVTITAADLNAVWVEGSAAIATGYTPATGSIVCDVLMFLPIVFDNDASWGDPALTIGSDELLGDARHINANEDTSGTNIQNCQEGHVSQVVAYGSEFLPAKITFGGEVVAHFFRGLSDPTEGQVDLYFLTMTPTAP